jgi:hypothetical protein
LLHWWDWVHFGAGPLSAPKPGLSSAACERRARAESACSNRLPRPPPPPPQFARKGVTLSVEAWLLKLMVGSIDPSYDAEDEGPTR